MTYCGKRPGNSHSRAATARVNMNLLKGALLLSKRHWINKTAHVKRVSVTQKTHFTHTRLMTIQTSEWVYYVLLTARSYRDVDLGLKSNMKGLRSLWSNSWPLGDKRSFTLHHRDTISQYFILIISNKRAADISPCPATALKSSKCHDSVNKLITFQENISNSFQVTERTKKKKKKKKEKKYYRNH